VIQNHLGRQIGAWRNGFNAKLDEVSKLRSKFHEHQVTHVDRKFIENAKYTGKPNFSLHQYHESIHSILRNLAEK
jgi:hypothetical protein